MLFRFDVFFRDFYIEHRSIIYVADIKNKIVKCSESKGKLPEEKNI